MWHRFQLSLSVLFGLSFASQENSALLSYKSHEFGKRYLVATGVSLRYDKAYELCEANNATLVQIRSPKESQWIETNIKPTAEFFLGSRALSDSNKPMHPTHFLDGSPIEWFNWKSGEPTWSSYNGCSAIYVSRALNLTWVQGGCSSLSLVMCESPLTFKSYAMQLMEAMDELKARHKWDREYITSQMKENVELKGKYEELIVKYAVLKGKYEELSRDKNKESLMEIGPVLDAVIDQMEGLTKKSIK